MRKTILQIRFFWSGLLGNIKGKREVKFGNFTLKQLPVPVSEFPPGKNCELEYLLEYEGEHPTDSNNKSIKLESNEILSILSFLTHRRARLIAWSYGIIPDGSLPIGDTLELHGEIKWDDKISSEFLKILQLDEEKRLVILRALVIYSQAINFLVYDITLGFLFLCIAIETLVSFVYPGKSQRKEKFMNFILKYIPSGYIKELSSEYGFKMPDEFKKYLDDIYHEYRSGFVHQGRFITSYEYFHMKRVKKLLSQKEFANKDGEKNIENYINLPIFESIVWETVRNYITITCYQ